MADVTFWVYDCPNNNGRGVSTIAIGKEAPHCNSGAGLWRNVTVKEAQQQEVVWADVVTYCSAVILIWTVGLGIGGILNIFKRGSERF